MIRRTFKSVTTHRVEVDAEDIRKLVGAPETAEVYVSVPGGGDWSNMDLTIDKKHTITVEWTDES